MSKNPKGHLFFIIKIYKMLNTLPRKRRWQIRFINFFFIVKTRVEEILQFFFISYFYWPQIAIFVFKQSMQFPIYWIICSSLQQSLIEINIFMIFNKLQKLIAKFRMSNLNQLQSSLPNGL